MKLEWRGAPDFAEIAEALEVNTKQIVMAKVDDPERIVALYTPDPEGDPPVFRAELWRDADGILVVMGYPRPVQGY